MAVMLDWIYEKEERTRRKSPLSSSCRIGANDYKAHLELSHGLFNGSLGVHAVHVVQVNVVRVQPFQGRFTCLPVTKCQIVST